MLISIKGANKEKCSCQVYQGSLVNSVTFLAQACVVLFDFDVKTLVDFVTSITATNRTPTASLPPFKERTYSSILVFASERLSQAGALIKSER